MRALLVSFALVFGLSLYAQDNNMNLSKIYESDRNAYLIKRQKRKMRGWFTNHWIGNMKQV